MRCLNKLEKRVYRKVNETRWGIMRRRSKIPEALDAKVTLKVVAVAQPKTPAG